MFGQQFYFGVKPYLPWRLRIAMRRLSARRKRAQFSHEWPIDCAAARPPAAWPGWPDGKRFAFVLTHDVESAAGLAKCRPLVELEQQLGFRSCFNLIPEGPYTVSPELREWLNDNGCEVGVHDLHHDGRLFNSHRRFQANAARINGYLKSWDAEGFRSGFMLRNLDWLHELQIRYDSSTFDTDPFEPQSEGVRTIFPFWIPSPRTDVSNGASTISTRSTGGYMELPYTLPQDSTLFILFKETSSEIWLRKLDWIAEHGGMALVNVHPDYLRFSSEYSNARTYSVRRYIELLEHVRSRHNGNCWHALPRAVADHLATTVPAAVP